MIARDRAGLLLVLGLLASGCGTGSEDCEPSCGGAKVRCYAIGSELAALAALSAAEAPASRSLGADARWVGAIKGLRITRNGTPSQAADSEILGVKIYTAGWVYKYCAGRDEIVYGAGPEVSTATRGCSTIECAGLGGSPPSVDSAAAIAAAFPGDPANTLYGLDFNPLVNGSRIWAVTRLSDGATKNVNGDTGAVIP